MQPSVCPTDTNRPKDADYLLHQFIFAADPTSAEVWLARLLSEYAEPLIRRVVGSKLRRKEERQDVDDVCSEVLLQLTGRLRGSRDAKGPPIANFEAYVATTAQNACYGYLRTKHRTEWNFRNKLKFLLNHRPEFWIRDDQYGQVVCGLTKGEKSAELNPPLQVTAQLDLNEFLSSNSATVEQAEGNPTSDFVANLLAWLGGTVYFDDLADLMAEMLGVQDQPLTFFQDECIGEGQQVLRDRTPDAVMRLAQSRYLARLWREVGALPISQRHALLLNLREMGQASALSLFVETGIVNLRQIAETLEIQLEAFTALWNQLPLDDNSIATRMGITRQRVINLRKSARKRLERRMRLVD
jgi:RNA polymerase sigma factor (sigma-70 family)